MSELTLHEVPSVLFTARAAFLAKERRIVDLAPNTPVQEALSRHIGGTALAPDIAGLKTIIRVGGNHWLDWTIEEGHQAGFPFLRGG